VKTERVAEEMMAALTRCNTNYLRWNKPNSSNIRNTLPPRITLHFQQLHSKNAGILLGDSSLADRPTGLTNSNPQAAFSSDLEREGGLVQKQQRAVTAAETSKLRRQ
jgi:hypothetical protein